MLNASEKNRHFYITGVKGCGAATHCELFAHDGEENAEMHDNHFDLAPCGAFFNLLQQHIIISCII